MEKKPNSQTNQGPMLSLRRRPRAMEGEGRGGQRMERARIFALPREPSPSHTSSLSCSSLEPIKLPPVHVGQPKVGPKNLHPLTVPEVQPRQPLTVPRCEEEAEALIHLRLRMIEIMEKKPNSQATQDPLLSLQRGPNVKDEAGKRGQRMERTRIFAGPREPSPSHTSSSCSSCSSLVPIRLPPVHLGQPKVGPKNLHPLTVPEVQPRQLQTVPLSEEEADALICLRLRMIEITENMEKTEKMKKKRNNQATQGPLLSKRRLPSVRDEAGKRCQQMERARIFALPREPSPSHTSSSSCSSLVPTKLPPVHLGQPKVGPRNFQPLRVPEVQLRQPQAAPQGSRSQALSLCGDRLPPLPPVPRPPALPRLLSPRDPESRGTELGSAGEKGPQPCSPCPRQAHSPVPRVLLPPLRVAQEGTARVSPSWQLLPVPPIPAGAAAMQRSLRGTVPEKQNDSKRFQEEHGCDQELSQVTEDVELFQEDSECEQELSLVEDESELSPEDSTAEELLFEVEESIELLPGDSDIEPELSEVEEAREVTSGDSTNEEEPSPVEEATEIGPGDTTSDQQLTPVEDYSELFPVDSTREKELPDVEEDIKVTSGGSTSDENLSPVEETINAISGDNLSEEELSPVEEAIEVGPENITSDQQLSKFGETIELFPGDSKGDKELSPGEEKRDEEASQGENDCAKELPQGDYNKDEKLSPEDDKYETELCFGEVSNVQDMFPQAADDNEPLSLCEGPEQEEMTRRALLGGRDRGSSSSPELKPPGTRSPLSVLFSTPGSSQAQLPLSQKSSREPPRQAVPELQALGQQRQQQQDALEPWSAAGRAAAAPPEREGSCVAAPLSPPRPWPAQPGAQALRGQPAASRKRPSRFRRALRALRGLIRVPCLGPRPEE